METRARGDITIIAIPSRLDGTSATDTEAGLRDLISRGSRKIVCDFSGTEYVSSAGMRVLLSTGKALSQAGGRLALCALRPGVRKVFEIAGFTRIFPIAESCSDLEMIFH